MKAVFIFVLALLPLFSLEAFSQDDSQPWLFVTLTSRGCAEIDTDVIGEACVYVAKDKVSGQTLFIYDSLPQADSDLGDWTKDYNLRGGQNCFRIQIDQTPELVHRYGSNSYYASKIKRVQCD